VLRFHETHLDAIASFFELACFIFDAPMAFRWLPPSLFAFLAVSTSVPLLLVHAQDPFRLGSTCFAANGNDLRAAVKVREGIANPHADRLVSFVSPF
jgi:hypothetical protein